MSQPRYDAVGLAWEGVVARRDPRAADPLDAALKAAGHHPPSAAIESLLAQAAARGLLPAQALEQVIAPLVLPPALAAFWAATTLAWTATSEARALLPALRYRGYGAFVVSEMVRDAGWLAAWLQREGLAGYAQIVEADASEGIGPQLARWGWAPARCLLVVPAGSGLAADSGREGVATVLLAPSAARGPGVVNRLPEIHGLLD